MRSATLALLMLPAISGCTSSSVVINNSPDFTERVRSIAYADPPAKAIQVTLQDDRKEGSKTFKFNETSIILYGDEEIEIPYEQIKSATVIKKSKSPQNAIVVVGSVVLAPVFFAVAILLSPLAIFESFPDKKK